MNRDKIPDKIGLVDDWGYPLLRITESDGYWAHYYPHVPSRLYSTEAPELIKGHPYWMTPTKNTRQSVAVFIAEDKVKYPYPFLLDVRE